MSSSVDNKKDFENNQATDEMFFQPVTICNNPFKSLENANSSKPISNILQPSHISKNNVILNNNLSYSPNKFRDFSLKNGTKSTKRCHTENSVNDENACQVDQDRKENIIHSTNKLTYAFSLSQVETKAESLNESIYRYNDRVEDQTEALLEKDEEIQMLKAKRMADSIEISYLKSLLQGIQNTTETTTIIDQGENFTFYNIQNTQENLYVDNKENIPDLYIESCIARLIERNCDTMKTFDLESEVLKVRDEQSKEKVISEKRILQLEGMIHIEQMFHRSLDSEKKNLISKLADMEIKLENQIGQQKQYQELLQKYKQEMGRLQEKLEFREYEINQLKEKKNVYQTKLKDYSDINQEYKQRLEDKDKQLEELKEKISEPIDNINMVFSIVSNYKQTLAQFDEKIAELIQKQKAIDKLERQLGEKNEQMMMLVKMSNQLQEKVNLLIHENSQQALIIQNLSEKLHQQEIQQLKQIQHQQVESFKYEKEDVSVDSNSVEDGLKMQETVDIQEIQFTSNNAKEEEQEEEVILEFQQSEAQIEEKLESNSKQVNMIEDQDLNEQQEVEVKEHRDIQEQSSKKKKKHNKHKSHSSHKKRVQCKIQTVNPFGNEEEQQ